METSFIEVKMIFIVSLLSKNRKENDPPKVIVEHLMFEVNLIVYLKVNN